MKQIAFIILLIQGFIFHTIGQVSIDTIDIEEISFFKSKGFGMNYPIFYYQGQPLHEINKDIREEILMQGNFFNQKYCKTESLLDSFMCSNIGLCYEMFVQDDLISLELYGLNHWGMNEFMNYSITSKKRLSLKEVINCEGVCYVNDSITALRLFEQNKINNHFDSLFRNCEPELCAVGHKHIPFNLISNRNEVLESVGFSKICGFLVNDSVIVIYLDKWHDNFGSVENFPLFFDKHNFKNQSTLIGKYYNHATYNAIEYFDFKPNGVFEYFSECEFTKYVYGNFHLKNYKLILEYSSINESEKGHFDIWGYKMSNQYSDTIYLRIQDHKTKKQIDSAVLHYINSDVAIISKKDSETKLQRYDNDLIISKIGYKDLVIPKEKIVNNGILGFNIFMQDWSDEFIEERTDTIDVNLINNDTLIMNNIIYVKNIKPTNIITCE